MAQTLRIVLPDPPADPDHLQVAGDDYLYLARSHRVRPGDAVQVVAGRPETWRGLVRSVGRDALELDLSPGPLLSGPPVRLTLIQAFLREPRLDDLVAQYADLGVCRLQLIPSLRNRRGEAPVSDSRLRRWDRIIMERQRLNPYPFFMRLEVLPDLEAADLDASVRLVFDTVASQAPPRSSLPARFDRASAVIGPEGGFDPREREALLAKGCLPATLGPQIWRAELAGVLAAGLVIWWSCPGSGPAPGFAPQVRWG